MSTLRRLAFYAFNQEDNQFNIGDTVYLTNTILSNDDGLFPAEVIKILSDEETRGLGVHYVCYVTTHVDDWIAVKPAEEVWRSRAQREALIHKLKSRQ